MADLNGRRILVVEDEPIVAMMVEDMLAELGAVTVGPAHTVGDALDMVAKGGIDAALLDVNLGGERSEGIAAALRGQGVPFVLATGYGAVDGGGYADAPVLQKPYQFSQLAEALERAMASSAP